MNTTTPCMSSLFEQLGLDGSDEAIERFISQHKLADHVKITEAPFWSDGQIAFLKECYRLDAEWVPIVDDLNAQLHH